MIYHRQLTGSFAIVVLLGIFAIALAAPLHVGEQTTAFAFSQQQQEESKEFVDSNKAVGRELPENEDLFFPYGTVEVSQWTTEALYNRFFSTNAISIIETNIKKTMNHWRSTFEVQLYTPCHKGNFVTTIQNQGSSSTPTVSHELQRPQVVLLDDNTIGLYGQLKVSAKSVANAWFIEGVCIAKDCKCTGFPVQHMCVDSPVFMTTTVDFRIRLDLNPSSSSRPNDEVDDDDENGGFLPLPIVEVFADGPTMYGNNCTTMNHSLTLPWFAQKFNNTFQDLLQKQFIQLVPQLHETMKFSLESFVNGSVHMAIKRYFPPSLLVSGGSVAKYRVNATRVASRALPTLGIADKDAFVAFNVTAAFSYTGDNGKKQRYMPWDRRGLPPQRRNTLWMPTSPFNKKVTATRLTFSTEALQVLSWFTSAQDDMNHNANNTILDATIETIVGFGTPQSKLLQSFSPIPWVNQSLDDDKVMDSIRKKQGGDGGEPAVILTMNTGKAQVSCKNGTMRLIEAGMENVTTRTYVAMELDESTYAYKGFRLSAPSHVLTFFFSIFDFNKFQGAKFQVIKPTGGFPQSVLASMLQKAMNETRPAMNDALRSTRLPLPPAMQLLLQPLEGTSSHIPQTSMQLIDQASQQGTITFSTEQSDAPPPLPLPPSLLEAVPVVVSLQEHPSRATSNWTSPIQLVRGQALLGQTCRVMTTLNNTVYYWVAVESQPKRVKYTTSNWKKKNGDDGSQKEEVVFATAMWPSKIDLFCTDSSCEKCRESFKVNTEGDNNDGSSSSAMQFTLKTATVLHHPVSLFVSIIAPQNVTSSQSSTTTTVQEEREQLCLQRSNKHVRSKAIVMGDSSLCPTTEGNGKAGSVERGVLSNLLAFDYVSEDDEPAYKCEVMPGQTKLLVAVSSSHSYAPCFTCPTDSTELRISACPLAGKLSIPLPWPLNPPAGPGELFGTCVTSPAGETYWLAKTSDIPECPLMHLAPAHHGSSEGFNVQLWIPVIVFGLLITGLAVAILARRYFKDKMFVKHRSRYNSVTGESTQLVTDRSLPDFDEEEDGVKYGGTVGGTNNSQANSQQQPAPPKRYHLELGVAASYPLIALLLSVLVLGVICGVTYWVLSPFGRYTSDRAYSHGVPHSINFDGLQHSLHGWTAAIAGYLTGMASAAFVCLVVVIAAVWKCNITTLRKFLSPGILAAIFAAFAVGFQFSVLSPPLGFSVKHMANVTLNMNITSTAVNRQRLDDVAESAASAAALLVTLPTVLHLMSSVASALPVAAGVACAIRAVLAARQDAVQCKTSDATPEQRMRTVFFLLGRRHNQADAKKGRAPRSMTDAVTSSWMMIITLCSTSIFAMSGVMALVTFQATREVTWLVFAIFRSCVSLIPLVSTYHLKEGCKLDDAKRIQFGRILAVVALALDIFFSVLMAIFTSINPSFPVFALHVCAIVVDTGFFFYLEPDSMAHAQHHQTRSERKAEKKAKVKRGMSHSTSTGTMANRTTSQRFVVPEAMSDSEKEGGSANDSTSSSETDDVSSVDSSRDCGLDTANTRENSKSTFFASAPPSSGMFSERGESADDLYAEGGLMYSQPPKQPWPITQWYYRHIVDPIALFSAPWWRVLCSAFATIFICLSYYELAEAAENPTLRHQLINIMSDNGIQFPKNISKVKLFVDPGIDAYNEALRDDLVPLGIGMSLAVLCTVTAIAVGLPDAHSVWRPRLTFFSRICSITSYIFLLIAALYFAVPDFVAKSNLGDIVPHCAPEFYTQGELAVTEFARIFFSSTVFGRLMPLLITFPPAIVRVLYLIGEQCGVTDQFSPMFVATVVTSLCIQLPLLSIVLIADANVVLALGAALPVSLFAVVFLFHPAIQSRDPIQGISFVWYILYIVGWVMLVWQAIKTNEVVWTVVQRVLQSKAVWYELVSGVFMATVAFCDVVWFVVAPKDERVIAKEREEEEYRGGDQGSINGVHQCSRATSSRVRSRAATVTSQHNESGPSDLSAAILEDTSTALETRQEEKETTNNSAAVVEVPSLPLQVGTSKSHLQEE